MSELNERKQVVSAYKELSGILSALKSEKITLNAEMYKIQLKESRPTRPYCKVTGTGALALYGISKQPIVMYAEQWNKLMKVTKSDYIDNYIKYNESRLKFKRPLKNNLYNKPTVEQHSSTKNDEINKEIIDDEDTEYIK